MMFSSHQNQVYRNNRLGFSITIPDGWEALVEDDAEASATVWLDFAKEHSPEFKSIADAYEKSREVTRRILRIVPTIIPYPSITFEETYSDQLTGGEVTLATYIDKVIEEARQIEAVSRVNKIDSRMIGGRTFHGIELAVSNPAEMVARTLVANQFTGILSIKFVGPDSESMDHLESMTIENLILD